MLKKLLNLIERTDKTLKNKEDGVIARVAKALTKAVDNLVKKLSKPFNKMSNNKDLLPNQKSLIIANEVKEFLNIAEQSEPVAQKGFLGLIQSAFKEGTNLAKGLLGAFLGDREDGVKLPETTPIEAITAAAEDSTRRLKKWGQVFADKATAAVEQGLIQGWGTKKTASAIRKEAGATVSHAEQIARTASLNATNTASKQVYQANKIKLVQWIATVDDRTCPYCSWRNFHVYELGKALVPAHVNCRCYLMPFRKEWLDKEGLVDIPLMKRLRKETLRQNRKINKGLTPFEKAAGYQETAAIMWNVDDVED